MVITMLEGRVAPDAAARLEAAYREAIGQPLDAGITESFLLRSKDSDLWRIVTVWESREALEAMRQSGGTPRGILMFRAAGVDPTLSILDVVAHGSRPA